MALQWLPFTIWTKYKLLTIDFNSCPPTLPLCPSHLWLLSRVPLLRLNGLLVLQNPFLNFCLKVSAWTSLQRNKFLLCSLYTSRRFFRFQLKLDASRNISKINPSTLHSTVISSSLQCFLITLAKFVFYSCIFMWLVEPLTNTNYMLLTCRVLLQVLGVTVNKLTRFLFSKFTFRFRKVDNKQWTNK